MGSIRELKRTFLLERHHGVWRLRRMFGEESLAEASDRTSALASAFSRLRDAAPCTISVLDDLPVRWALTSPSSEWEPTSPSAESTGPRGEPG